MPRPRGTTGGWLRRAVRPVVTARTWVISAYLLLSVVTGIFWFTLLVTGISTGLGMALIWVGVLVLAVLPFLWRWGARTERAVTSWVFGVEIPAPYRTWPSGSLLQEARLALTDPATWKDLTYLVVLFPLGTLWSAVTAAVWSHSLTLLTAPLYYYALPAGQIDWLAFSAHPVTVDLWWKALVAAVVGLVLTVPAAWIVRGIGRLHGLLARALLGPSQAQALAAEAIRLRASRDRTVDAAAAERRRIERDLHDGAQQRLTSLAMDLGMAKVKLRTDPAAVEPLLAHAHAEAKRAIAELRDLARGVHPAILAEQGLDASLSALAGRCPVPVETSVALPQRPPLEAETTAYFVVAEALANVAKHAHASRAWVTIHRHPTAGSVHVEVHDDGAGGARTASGGGLAGLASRVAAAGGTLEVSSPEGGPTVIHAEVPCAS